MRSSKRLSGATTRLRAGDEASPRAPGTRRCTNPECKYGGWWIVGKMVRIKNGKLLCRGRGCHTIYQPAETIDPESPDYRLWVSED